MSVEVLLIPLGIAAVAALREVRSTDLCEKCRATRVTEAGLLAQALSHMGAEVTSLEPDRLLATSAWGDLTFQKVGNIFLGRVDRDERATVPMLAELDRSVGLVAQQRTAELLLERAEVMGFRLIEYREDDGALNYVFEEI